MRRIAKLFDLADLLGVAAVTMIAIAAAGYDWRLGLTVVGVACLALALAMARADPASPAG